MKKTRFRTFKYCMLAFCICMLGMAGCKKSDEVNKTGSEVTPVITDAPSNEDDGTATKQEETTQKQDETTSKKEEQPTSELVTSTPKEEKETKNQRDVKPEDIDWSVVPEELQSSTYDLRKALSVIPMKEAYQDYFWIGTAINGSDVNVSSLRSPEMNAIAAYHFNSITYSNLMKPSYLLDQNGSKANFAKGVNEPAVKFDTVIEGLEWCKDNGVKMRGHTLVWHTQAPDWFFKEGFETNGEYVDKDTMLERMESYIKQVLEFTQTNYSGVIYCWDVVNEAVENSYGYYDTESSFQVRTHWDVNGVKTENPWYKTIGEEYVEKAFEFARKYADKDVKLFYNDYNTFQKFKCISIYALAKQLKEKGLIDGIGMQGYYSLSYPSISSMSGESVRSAIERFAKLELEIHLTELSLKCNSISEEQYELQAEKYKELFSLLLKLDTDNGGPANITCVTFFGIMDEYMFYSNNTENTRMFDGKLQPKEAYYSIIDAVTEYEATK